MNEHLLEQIEGVITFLIKEKSDASIGGIGNHSTPEQLDKYNRAAQSLGHLIHYRDELTANHFDHKNS